MNSLYLYCFQCACILVFVVAIICIPESFAESDAVTHDASHAERAWLYYKSGEYAKSRKIIEDNYSENNVELSLLSGMIYAKEGDCDKALSAIEYLRNYLLVNKGEVEQDSQIKEYYTNVKLLEIDCYQKLGNWPELHKSLTEYIPYTSGSEKLDKLIMLGDAKLMLSESGVAKGIRACESALNEIQDDNMSGYKERCLYVLTELYTLSGRREDAVRSFIRLLEIADDKQSWASKLQSSHHYRWILENQVIVEMLLRP